RAHEEVLRVGCQAERKIAQPEEGLVHEGRPASPDATRFSTRFHGLPAISRSIGGREHWRVASSFARPERTGYTPAVAPSRTPIPRAFYVVSAANFLSFLNLAFYFLLPLWVQAHGGGAELAGRVGAINGFAGLAALPFLGVLLDRFGRRRFM